MCRIDEYSMSYSFIKRLMQSDDHSLNFKLLITALFATFQCILKQFLNVVQCSRHCLLNYYPIYWHSIIIIICTIVKCGSVVCAVYSHSLKYGNFQNKILSEAPSCPDIK